MHRLSLIRCQLKFKALANAQDDKNSVTLTDNRNGKN
jgi:hypothetical protein